MAAVLSSTTKEVRKIQPADMFGISDHDLMHTGVIEVEDSSGTEYIEARVRKAEERIMAESEVQSHLRAQIFAGTEPPVEPNWRQRSVPRSPKKSTNQARPTTNTADDVSIVNDSATQSNEDLNNITQEMLDLSLDMDEDDKEMNVFRSSPDEFTSEQSSSNTTENPFNRLATSFLDLSEEQEKTMLSAHTQGEDTLMKKTFVEQMISRNTSLKLEHDDAVPSPSPPAANPPQKLSKLKDSSCTVDVFDRPIDSQSITTEHLIYIAENPFNHLATSFLDLSEEQEKTTSSADTQHVMDIEKNHFTLLTESVLDFSEEQERSSSSPKRQGLMRTDVSALHDIPRGIIYASSPKPVDLFDAKSLGSSIFQLSPSPSQTFSQNGGRISGPSKWRDSKRFSQGVGNTSEADSFSCSPSMPFHLVLEESSKEESHLVLEESSKEESHLVLEESSKEESHLVLEESSKEESHLVLEESSKEESHLVLEKSSKEASMDVFQDEPSRLKGALSENVTHPSHEGAVNPNFTLEDLDNSKDEDDDYEDDEIMHPKHRARLLILSDDEMESCDDEDSAQLHLGKRKRTSTANTSFQHSICLLDSDSDSDSDMDPKIFKKEEKEVNNQASRKIVGHRQKEASLKNEEEEDSGEEVKQEDCVGEEVELEDSAGEEKEDSGEEEEDSVEEDDSDGEEEEKIGVELGDEDFGRYEEEDE